MAYDEALVARIREAIVAVPHVDEKAMFGGVAFMLDGKMFVGVVNRALMVRVGPDREAEALAQPHVRPMDFTGRPMRGYVFVDEEGCASIEEVERWAALGMAFTSTLPTKPPAAPRTSKATKRGAPREGSKAPTKRDDAVTTTRRGVAASAAVDRTNRKTPRR